jgi:hypothetical protein
MEFQDPDRTEVYILAVVGAGGFISFIIQTFL